MNANREMDRLDAAIDHTAARMVAVTDDPDMVTRIVSALPERPSRFGWLIPQLAAIGAMVIAAIVWTTRGDTPSIAALLSSDFPGMTGLATTAAAHRPRIAVGAAPVPRVEELTLQERLTADFDRSLPAIEVASSLSVADVQTRDIAMPAAIGLASIDIADLKLTAEFTTQKEE